MALVPCFFSQAAFADTLVEVTGDQGFEVLGSSIAYPVGFAATYTPEPNVFPLNTELYTYTVEVTVETTGPNITTSSP
jgi:hypothetical protein